MSYGQKTSRSEKTELEFATLTLLYKYLFPLKSSETLFYFYTRENVREPLVF